MLRGPSPPPLTAAQIDGLRLAQRAGDLAIQMDWPIAIVPRDDRDKPLSKTNKDPRPLLVDVEEETCTCEECRRWKALGFRCKHMWAVIYTFSPPQTVSAPTNPGLAVPRLEVAKPELVVASENGMPTNKRYVRGGYHHYDCSKYQEALRHNPADFILVSQIIAEQCGIERLRVNDEDEIKRGNKGYPFWAYLFAGLQKAYHGKSLRWTDGFCRYALAENYRGFEGREYPHHAALGAWLRDPETTPHLRRLLLETATPPIMVNGSTTRLAADMTGVGANRFFDYRLDRRAKPTSEGGQREKKVVDGRQIVRGYWRANVLACVDTLATTAVIVTDQHTHESAAFKKLTEETLREFESGVLLADGGYKGPQRQFVLDNGWLPYFRYGSNEVATHKQGMLKTLFLEMQLHPKIWKLNYSPRWKIECLFSVIDQKFGKYIHCTEGAGPENEIILKFIANNILMLCYGVRIYDMDLEMFNQKITLAA